MHFVCTLRIVRRACGNSERYVNSSTGVPSLEYVYVRIKYYYNCADDAIRGPDDGGTRVHVVIIIIIQHVSL